jgi:hypothetical protein
MQVNLLSSWIGWVLDDPSDVIGWADFNQRKNID